MESWKRIWGNEASSYCGIFRYKGCIVRLDQSHYGKLMRESFIRAFKLWLAADKKSRILLKITLPLVSLGTLSPSSYHLSCVEVGKGKPVKVGGNECRFGLSTHPRKFGTLIVHMRRVNTVV